LIPQLRAWSSNDGRLFGLRIIGTSDAARELIARADELGVGTMMLTHQPTERATFGSATE
jgi:hypothetical protein